MASDGAPIGALAVRVGADATDLVNEFGKAGKASDKLQSRLELASEAAAAFAAAAAATAAAVVLMVKSALDGADAMSKMAQGAGVATQTFSELAHAAKLSDISTEGLSTSMGRLNRNILDASAGTGDAVRAFEALGIEVKNADGSLKSADVVMAEVADQFAGMEDGAGKSGLALMLFGRAGAAMIPMLNSGSEGLRLLREEARQLGVTIDTETGKAAEEFNDTLTRMGQVQQGAANKIMADLLPAMQAVADEMLRAAKETNAFSMAGEVAKTVFQTIAVLGSDLAFVFKMVGGEIGVIMAQLAAVARGDFSGARLIGEEWTRDAEQARKDLDDLQKRIMEVHRVSAGGAMDEGVGLEGVFSAGKRAAPGIEDTSAAAKAAADALATAKAIQEGLDEEQKIQAEADALVVEHRNAELEAEASHYAERMRIWFEFIDQKQAAEEQAMREEAALVDSNMTAIEKFQRMSYTKQAQTVFGALSNITAGVSQHNRKMFELNKAAGIGMALVNAYEGISLTLKSYPYPWNIAMAAAHGIAAFAQVNAIRSQSFGGGGGAAPSIAGSTAAPPVSPVSGGAPGGGSGGSMTKIFNINVSGSGRAVMEEFAQRMNQLADEGFEFRLNGQRA